ncbi:hypothetical protein [uncultured Roseobacter sp.]|uniref:hypothetical protein n=1 Tax=uncultured Roseobacter sp. TaxID=114847 RepID=UPI00262DB5B0|nr:hypothetical protein [uncultured Roseobacter sp.]
MRFLAFFLTAFCMATPAFAYIGPGAGLGAIGILIAIIGGILLLVVGFLWYPIKRMMRKKRDGAEPAPGTENE